MSISNNRGEIRTSSTFYILIACFAGRHLCLRESICFITMKIVLARITTIISSRMNLGDPWEASPRLCNSNIGPSISGRTILGILRSKTKWFILFPKIPARALNWKGSISSRINIPGSTRIIAEALLETITTPIYLSIDTVYSGIPW